jgi:hypothetical protein
MPAFLDARPTRFRHWSVAAFGAWSVFVWATRVRNIFRDEDLSSGEKAAWLVPAVVFTAGGLLALVAWARGRDGFVRPLAAVAMVTILYWPVRLVLVLVGDEGAAFKAVHTVLAVVSVALAYAMGRRLVRTNLLPRAAYQ